MIIQSHLSKRLLSEFHQAKFRSLPYMEILNRLTLANSSALNRVEYEAVNFIEKTAKTFPERLPVVSFSGGKDSAVVSHLVRLALGPRIIHIFGDTTLEYPDTYKYIEKFKKDNPKVPFITARPTKNFFELADEIGPPSRILRWCCTTHKIGPLGQIKNLLNGDGILAFIGNRKAESSHRNGYKSINNYSKIANEIIINPILTWNDTELWLYIFKNKINVNNWPFAHFLRVVEFNQDDFSGHLEQVMSLSS